MDMMFIQEVILPIVYIVVGVALVWALVELILFLRKTSKTVSSVEDQVQPLLADAKEMTESLKPAVEKIDPLVERVSLTVDAANLEIMRIDGILEDVSDITDTASRTVEAVDTVAQTPMRLVNGVSDKLRTALGNKDASDDSLALGQIVDKALSGLCATNDAAFDENSAEFEVTDDVKAATNVNPEQDKTPSSQGKSLVDDQSKNKKAVPSKKVQEHAEKTPDQNKYFTYNNVQK